MSAWLLTRMKRTVIVRQLLCLCECASHNKQSTDYPGQTRSGSTGSKTFNKTKSIVDVSSTIVQDRTGTNELPMIIRRVGTDAMKYGNKYNKEVSEETKALPKQLQDCINMQQVLKFLQIPYHEKVCGHTALLALLKLYRLEQAQNTKLVSSLNKSIVEELFQVVAKDLETVKNGDLIALVEGYIKAEDYSDHVLRLAEEKMSGGKFTVTEVFSLSTILACEIHKSSLNNKGSVDLLLKCWVHLTSRHKLDITYPNIGMLLEKFPVQMKARILGQLTQHITTFNWQLEPQIFVDLGKCVVELLDDFDPSDLSDVIAVYQTYFFYYRPLFAALEKYVMAKQAKVDISLLSQILQMFRQFRYFSSEVMDAAATVFMSKGFLFSPDQLYNILMVFGYFGHMPEQERAFLSIAEAILLNKVNSFQVDKYLELLLSFHYLNCNLENFMELVLSMDFAKKMNDLNPDQKLRAFVVKRRLSMQQNYDIHLFLPAVLVNTDKSNYVTENVAHLLRRSLRMALDVGQGFMLKNVIFHKHTQGLFFDCLFGYTSDETGIEFVKKPLLNTAAKRVMIKIIHREDMCINRESLLGEKIFFIQFCQKMNCRVILLFMEQLKEGNDAWLKILRAELSDIRNCIKERSACKPVDLRQE